MDKVIEFNTNRNVRINSRSFAKQMSEKLNTTIVSGESTQRYTNGYMINIYEMSCIVMIFLVI